MFLIVRKIKIIMMDEEKHLKSQIEEVRENLKEARKFIEWAKKELGVEKLDK